MRRNMLKSKVLAVALSALMGVTCMPNAVFAEGTGTSGASSQEIEINETNFPDDNLRAKVKEDVDSNKDDKLSQSEIARFEWGWWFDAGIKDTKGIEYLTGLRILYLEGNDISSIDTSNLTNLRQLRVNNNKNLKYIDVTKNEKLVALSAGYTGLTDLDISHNENLEYLDATNNSMTSIDVSHNPKLQLLNLQYNKLKNIDVSKNKELKILGLRGNELTTLDVSNNIHLGERMEEIADGDDSYVAASNGNLNFRENHITHIDLSKNPSTAGKVASSGNTYDIEVPCTGYDLKQLPGNDQAGYFDTTKVYKLFDGCGAVEKDGKLYVKESGPVTYTYNMLNGYGMIPTLNVTFSHVWTYQTDKENSSIVKAYCEGETENPNCEYSEDKALTLKIAAKDAEYTGIAYNKDGKEVTVTNDITEVTGKEASEIVYYKADANGKKTGNAIKAPTEAGRYIAEVTIGNQSASTSFEIKKKPEVKPTPKPSNTVSKTENNIALNAGLKVTQTGSKIKIYWGSVKKADGYNVYVQYCGKKFTAKSLNQVKNGKKTNITVTKVNGKKLDLKKNYKIYVTAYQNVNGKKKEIAKSITAHIVGRKNTKQTNVKSIKAAKTSYTLKVGKTAKIKAKTVLVNPKKKPLSDDHAKELRYATSNKKIATVSSNGKIKGVKKGTCSIYVYARNGYAKKLKVTIKE